MRAARLHAYGEPLHIDEVSMPPCGPDDVLVRIGGVGVCHSDLHAIKGEMGRPEGLPRTMGHENAGYVETVGANVTDFSRGEAVAVFGGWGCGHCRLCRQGEEQLCGTWRFTAFVDTPCRKRLEATDDFRQSIPPLCRGGFQTRPYTVATQNQYAVNVVRHDNERVEANMRIMSGQVIPGLLDHASGIGPQHCFVYHLTKQALSSVGHYGDEIRAALRIVVTRQPKGSTAARLRIVRQKPGLRFGLRGFVPGP